MIRRDRFVVAALIILILLVLTAVTAFAETPVGMFTKVEGGVDVLRPHESAVSQVRVGDSVAMGDAVRTKRNAKAEIRFKDDSVIQLAPETRIVIDEYTFRADQSRESGFLRLFRGKVRAIVSKVKAAVVPVSRSDSGFNIKTPTAVAGVKGTDFIVYYQRGVTGIVFMQGSGFAYNPAQPDKMVMIRAGQASFVTNETAAPTKAQPVSSNFVSSIIKNTTSEKNDGKAGGDSGNNSGKGSDTYKIAGTTGGATSSTGNQGSGSAESNQVAVVVTASSTFEALASLADSGSADTGTLQKPKEYDPVQPPTQKSSTETDPSLLPTKVNVHVPLP